MATIQERNGSFCVLFVCQGRRCSFTAGRVSRAAAEAHAEKVEELLALLADGTRSLPEAVSVSDFMLHKGKPPAKPATRAGGGAPDVPVKFADFEERYLAARSGGSMEASSLATARMHLGHFGRTLGKGFDVRKLTLSDLQGHLNAKRKGRRGGPLSPATLRLEMATLRAAWNWAALGGLVVGQFPGKGLQYPKADEPPPFMNFDEAERRVRTGADASEVWECVYLRKPEIEQFLAHVKQAATAPWLFPMVATAAYTGARRSELLRMEAADVDLEAGTLLVREKKRSRKQRTTRRVSLTPAVETVLREWLAAHPGGKHLFCQAGLVARSRKRSGTTGHKGEKTRESSLKGRTATVRRRGEQSIAAVTKDEAHDHLKRTLAGSRWEVLKGYHVLRHSFISCLAAEGVDQRSIDDFVGHCSEEQRRRYRHLLPDVKQRAIAGVFG